MKDYRMAWFVLAALAVMVAVVVACGGDDDDDDDAAGFQLTLLDAPVDNADAIYMTVTAASLRESGSWTDLEVEPGRINLLELQNNEGLVLVQQDLPAGDYNELRLTLACDGEDAPAIEIEGETFPLKVPSGCTSGFKIKGDMSVSDGAATVLILDFDARKSIHETANGYNLNPVIRVIRAEDAGTVSGRTDPAVPRTAIYAFAAGEFADDNFDDAANSTIARDDGTFTLAALPAGTYDVVVVAPGYDVATVAGLEVAAGEDTTIDDAIELTASAN